MTYTGCFTLQQFVIHVGLLLRLVQPSSVTADAETVSQHLRDMTGCDVSLHPNDYLCYNCYKVHSSILTSLQSKQQEPDCMLQSLMEIWIAKGGDKDTDALTRAVLKAVLFVAEQLLQQKTVLLPWASQIFLQAYQLHRTGSIKSAELNPDC